MRRRSIHSSMDICVSAEWVCARGWMGVAAELTKSGESPMLVSAPPRRPAKIIHTVMSLRTPCCSSVDWFVRVFPP